MNLIFANFCLIAWREILFIFQMKNWSNIFFIFSDSLMRLDCWAAIADWNDKKEEEEEEEEEEVNWNDEDCCHWIDCKDCCHEEDCKNCCHEEDCEDCYHEEDCENCCHNW